MFDITQTFNQKVVLRPQGDHLGRHEVSCRVVMMRSGLRGWFDIRIEALKKVESGGLWFARTEQGGLELVDYDGTDDLSDCVATILVQQGISVPKELL